jgi:predicted metal-dependent phosphoesterase TrpH
MKARALRFAGALKMTDLHCHTDQSDGTDSPAELIRLAAETGITALAITDHDTLDGTRMARPLADAAGITLITGIEISTHLPDDARTVEKARRRVSVHLLVYFPHAEPPPAFDEWLGSWQAARRRRNAALSERLHQLGLAVTVEEAEALGRNMTGRPHFARVMMRKGYVSSVQEAFDRYLGDTAQAAVDRQEPSLFEAIAFASACGGVASLAHPSRLAESRYPRAVEALLERAAASGLKGVEAYYSDHSPAETHRYLALAASMGLVATGGSDYHGGNKPGIALGRGRGLLDVPASVVEALRATTSG